MTVAGKEAVLGKDEQQAVVKYGGIYIHCHLSLSFKHDPGYQIKKWKNQALLDTDSESVRDCESNWRITKIKYNTIYYRQ